MVFNRVEHVERVEDWEKGLSHKDHKEHKDGFRRWGFTPYPECAIIVGDLQVAFNAESQRRGGGEGWYLTV